MKEYKLEDLFDLQMGKTPARDESSYWDSDDYKWISIGDLSKCDKYITETKECITEKAVRESGISLIPANTVIMSFKLSIGKTAITNEPMYSNEAIMSFRDKHVVDLLPDYVYYLLSSRNWDEGTNKAVMGKTLNKATLSKVKINIHEAERQRQIVNVLDKVKQIIALRRQQLQKLDDLIRSRFVEIFGEPLNNPLRWDMIQLGKRCEIITGNTPSRTESKNYGDYIEWIKSDNINTPSTYLTEAQEKLSEIGFQKSRHVDAGSVLMTCIAGSIGCIGNVAVANRRVAFNQQINAIVPYKDQTLYIYWLMQMIKPLIHRMINMSLKGILNKNQLSQLKLPFPPIILQNRFAAFAKLIDKTKDAAQHSIDEFQHLFDCLLQKNFG